MIGGVDNWINGWLMVVPKFFSGVGKLYTCTNCVYNTFIQHCLDAAKTDKMSKNRLIFMEVQKNWISNPLSTPVLESKNISSPCF